MVSLLALLFFISLAAGCNTANKPNELTPTDDLKFDFIFKYGFEAKNVLDTFNGTYTKDMVVGPPVVTKMSLSKDELNAIYNKMIEIGFFNYPDVFAVPLNGGPASMITPYSSFYFKVEYGTKIKEFAWEDYITNQNNDADRLRELIGYIQDIVESKEEYKKLPPARGGYD